MSAAEHAYLREMRGAPFAAYRWSGSTALGGHPAAGATHYGVVAEHVLYRVPMIALFRYAPDDPDPTFFLNTDMWDL